MDFISVSYYEHQLAHPGNISNFDEIVCAMNDAVIQYNVSDIITSTCHITEDPKSYI